MGGGTEYKWAAQENFRGDGIVLPPNYGGARSIWGSDILGSFSFIRIWHIAKSIQALKFIKMYIKKDQFY